MTSPLTENTRLDNLTRLARMRGDDICGALMDSFGIARSRENYVMISSLLFKYKNRLELDFNNRRRKQRAKS